MKLRRLVTAGAIGVSAVLAVTSTGIASGSSVPSDSLRALADDYNLKIGSAIIPFDLDNPAYAKVAGEQFSSVTPGNEMKWETVEPTRGTYDWSKADRLVSFAEAHGQQVRGHVLLWHNQLPGWLTSGVADGSITKAQLRDLLQKHITDEVAHFKGKIWQWDVANEFFADSWSPQPLANGMNGDDFWVKNLGTGIVADAFRWAHAADPKALLFYNDYNITGADGTNAKFQAAYDFVKSLKEQGVPIDGVGEQGHLDTQYGFPTKMQQDLQAFADLGLRVAITEADVRTFVEQTDDKQTPTDQLAMSAQPFYYDQMLKACLAVRSCISFTVWGFGEADSWVPGWFTGEGYAGIYNTDVQPKTAYYTLQQDLQLAQDGAQKRKHH
ncbi:endo-1,4-beta-xylanase [Motilibacter rhizosphaerae]|uniref:Beta-xylanase n=1 Tax=Motilibacter rhizosphaerae TaxID=598652 RepID=A0A4Q7NRX7_9ACTN|nr:endo-1,4-beta-xylanase [Motilibacter rhizosphaerae]RZS89528.1 endo-1,4-beta-xylanase [Motilibacter rhizosphaerae]